MAEQAENVTFVEGKGDVVNGADGAEGFGEGFDGEGWLLH